MKNKRKNPFAETKVHYKLVKSTKGWLAIGLTTLSLATASFLSVSQVSSKADTTVNTEKISSSASTASDNQSNTNNSQASQSSTQQTGVSSTDSASNDEKQANSATSIDNKSEQSQANNQSKSSTQSGAKSEAKDTSTSITSAKSVVSSQNSQSSAKASAQTSSAVDASKAVSVTSDKQSQATSASQLNTNVKTVVRSVSEKKVSQSDSINTNNGLLTDNQNQVNSTSSAQSASIGTQSMTNVSAESATPASNTQSSSAASSVFNNTTVTVGDSTSVANSYQINQPTFKARWDATAVTASTAATTNSTVNSNTAAQVAQQNNVTLTFLNADGTNYMNPRVLARGDKLGQDAITRLGNVQMKTPEDGRGGKEVFNGWYYQVNDGTSDTKFDANQPVLRDATLVARFTRQFLVQFDNLLVKNGNTTDYVQLSQPVNDGDTMANPVKSADLDKLTPPTAGERFVYWYEDTPANQKLVASEIAPISYKFGIEPVNEDMHLKAYFANVATVTFKTEGEPVEPQLVTLGETVTAPSVSREGYKFVGWTTNSSVTNSNWSTNNAYDFSTPITKDTNLYAVWDPQQVHYNVVFWVEKLDQNGNPYPDGQKQYDLVQKVASTSTVLTGTNIDLTQSQINKYYAQLDSQKYKAAHVTDAINFSKYASEDTNVEALGNGQSNVNVYYNLIDYTFSFNYDSGYYDTTKEGYYQYKGINYYGIYDNNMAIDTSDLVVTNTDQENPNNDVYQFKAKYNQNISALWPVVKGTAYSSNDYQAVGFYGWSGGADRVSWVSKRVNLTQDMLENANANNDFTVNLTPNFVQYDIATDTVVKYYLESIDSTKSDGLEGTFQNPDGGYYADLLTNYLDQFNLVGGQLQSKQIPGAVVGNDRTAYKAVTDPDDPSKDLIRIFYRRASFDLSFDAQDGKVADNSTSQIKYQAPINAKDFPTPTRTGYVFDGWYVDASGTQPFVQNGQAQFTTMPARNVTLFAKWTPETYTVRYFADYNDWINQKPITELSQFYGLNDGIALPTKYNSSFIDPKRGVFSSWNYLNGSSALQMNNGFLITRAYDLFASYQSVKFNVQYSVDSTNFSQPITVPTDTNKYGFNTIIRLADTPANQPINSDTVFLGWQDSNGKNYTPGDFVRIDNSLVPNVNLAGQDLTLTFTAQFAKKAEVISVKFDPNLDGLAIATIRAVENQKLTVLSQSYFNVTNVKLLGWSLADKDDYSNTPEYLAGTEFPASDGQIFKAIWQPVIQLSDGAKTYDGTTNLPTDLLKLTGQSLIMPTNLTAADFDWQLITQSGDKINSTNVNSTALVNAGKYSFKLNNSGIQKLRDLNKNFDFDQLLQENSQAVVGNGTYTINKAPATLSVHSGSAIYTGGELKPTIDSTGTVGDEKLDYTVTGHTNVGNQLPVTITLTTGSQVNQNYDITLNAGWITINPATVAVQFTYQGSHDYNGQALTSADIQGVQGTVTDTAFSKLAKLDLSQATYVIKAVDTNNTGFKNLGVYNVYLSDASIIALQNANPNLTLTGLNQSVGQFTINKRPVTVTVNGQTVIYDGQQHDLTASVTAGTVVDGETLDYTVNNQPNAQKAAGTYTINATVNASATNDNYDIQFVSGKLVIQHAAVKADLQSTPVNESQVYDGKTIAAQYTPQVTLDFNLGNNQKWSIDPKLMAFEYRLESAIKATENPKNVGSYSVYLTADAIKTIEAANPNITMTGLDAKLGTYTITPKQVTVTVNGESKTYNGAQQKLETSTISGLIEGETLDLTYLNMPDQINVGEYTIDVQFTSNSDTDANYRLDNHVGTLKITQAVETLQFNTEQINLERMYNRASLPTSGLAEITAQLAGKSVDLSKAIYEYHLDNQIVDNPENVATYDIYLTQSSLQAIQAAYPNFDLSKTVLKVGTYKITPAPVTITVQDASVDYNGQQHNLDVKTAGVMVGDNLHVTVKNQTDQVAAGVYKDIVAIYDSNPNYSVAATPGTLTIKPAKMTLQFNVDQIKLEHQYDRTTLPTTKLPGIKAVLNGQMVDLSNAIYEYHLDSRQVGSPMNAGTYDIYLTQLSLQAIQAANPNYDLTGTPLKVGTYEITQTPVTIKVQTTSASYDGQQHNLVAVTQGVIAGDNLNVVVDNQLNQIAAGIYKDITAKFVDNANYTVNVVPGTLTITPAKQSLQFTADQTQLKRQYNRTDLPTSGLAGITAQLDGKSVDLSKVNYEYYQNGEKINDPMNAGTYNIYLTQSSLQSIQVAYPDYDLSGTDLKVGTYVITAAPVTVTVQDAKVDYDGKQHNLIAETTGVISGDKLNVTVNNKSQVAAGTYPVDVTFDSNANYDVTNHPGQLTINKVTGQASFSLTNPQNSEQIYNGQTIQDQYTPKVIGKLTFNGQSKDIDLSATDFEYRLGTTVNTDTKNVGNYSIHLTKAAIQRIENLDSSVEVQLNDDSLGNYMIKKRSATITVVDKLTDVYDGSQHDLQLNVVGMVGSEKAVATADNQTQINAQTYTVGVKYDPNDSVNRNYSFVTNDGTLIIKPAQATVDFNLQRAARLYNGQAISKNDLSAMTATFDGIKLDLTAVAYSIKQSDQTVEDPKNVGSYDIYLTPTDIKELQAQNPNYDLTNLSQKVASYTINKQPVSLSFDSQELTYDGNPHQLASTLTGVQNGEQLDYSTTNPFETNVGSYSTVTKLGNEAVNSNYDIQVNEGTLTIVPQPMTVQLQLDNPAQAQKVYDGQPINYQPKIELPAELHWGKSTPQLEYYLNGQLVAKPKNVGQYTIRLSQDSLKDLQNANPNFDLGTINSQVGTYQITKATAKIIVNNVTTIYGGFKPSSSVTTSGVIKGEHLGYHLDTSQVSANVGSYQVEAVLDADSQVNDNYQIELLAGNVTINKLPASGQFVDNQQLSKVYDGKSIDYVPTVQLNVAESSSNSTNAGLELLLDDDNSDDLLHQVTLVAGDYQIKGLANQANLIAVGDYQITLTQQGIKHIEQANPNIEFTGLDHLSEEYSIVKRPVKVTINQLPTTVLATQVQSFKPTATVTNDLPNEPVSYQIIGMPKDNAAGTYQLQVQLVNNDLNYQVTLTGAELTVVPVSVSRSADAIYAVETVVEIIDQNTGKTIKTVTKVDNPGNQHDITTDIPDNYHVIPDQPIVITTPDHPSGVVKVIVVPNQVTTPVTPSKPTDGGTKVTTPVTPSKPTDGGTKVTTPVTPSKPTDGGTKVTTPVTPSKPTDGGTKVTTPVTPTTPVDDVTKVIQPVTPDKSNGGKTVVTKPVQPSKPADWDPILVIVKTTNGKTVTEHTVEGYLGTTVDISYLIPQGYHLVPGESTDLVLNDVTPQIITVEPDVVLTPTTAGPEGINKGIGQTAHLKLDKPLALAVTWKPSRKTVAEHLSEQKLVSKNSGQSTQATKPNNTDSLHQSVNTENSKLVVAAPAGVTAEAHVDVDQFQPTAKQTVATKAKVAKTNSGSKQNRLPQTDETAASSVWGALGLAMASILGLFGLGRRKKETDETK